MGLRITTWNVNGIRNPFGYQPWRDKRSFSAMFDILEADIVVFQETKIQRKDLTDDMVLVPGWDCYFSLPRHKKGYSGVVIYTRQSTCAPIRAEEGITGVLCPPNSSLSFSELSEELQIGGYPTPTQLAASAVDIANLDSEGRCVILEFPALVLIGVYSPANRDETRDEFRLGFLNVLDSRVRNLVSEGKRVFLTGDLNISREELDAANAEAAMRKQGLTGMEFVSTPARRLFNHLLEGGKVFGERDEGREMSILWDICRGFHPDRKGMFTCWEQKVNARPGNCGSRIDYVLCSVAMKSWFSDSNIQEGLMGSDHCPVYAVMKDKVLVDGEERDVQDVMNPPGMFSSGIRQRSYSATNDPLPMSGKLIPEFFGRRNIRDMFARKPSLQQSQSTFATDKALEDLDFNTNSSSQTSRSEAQSIGAESTQGSNNPGFEIPKSSPVTTGKRRHASEASTSKTSKRSKSTSGPETPPVANKGQKTLRGFFKPQTNVPAPDSTIIETPQATESSYVAHSDIAPNFEPSQKDLKFSDCNQASLDSLASTPKDASTNRSPKAIRSCERSPSLSRARSEMQDEGSVHDPVESKESWSKLFTKPVAPRCEGHDEPCISLLTKKPGMNLGRSFWMCPRPLGPSGSKEKNTQWRCQTFIWCSDWNSSAAHGG